MSLVDRTNETIPLSIEPGADGYSEVGEVETDVDGDWSFNPSMWVTLSFTTADHDSDTFRFTFAEAGLLHDRLGLILGRSGTGVGQ